MVPRRLSTNVLEQIRRLTGKPFSGTDRDNHDTLMRREVPENAADPVG